MFLGHWTGLMVQKGAAGMRFVASTGRQGRYSGGPE
jgi:hypothetical protein